MIELPKSLTLKADKRSERALLEASREWLAREDRAAGIHASDLLDIRQAYFKHTSPRELNDREVGLFMVGKVLHSFVLSAGIGQSADLERTDEGSRYSETLKIWYSTDWDQNDAIAEFKTSRRMTEPQTVGEMDTYLEQILTYMAAKQVLTAKLWVLFLNLRDKDSGKTTPTFRCYTVSLTGDDLLSVTRMVSEQRELLETALTQGTPGGLPVCRSWKCGSGNCPWWDECRPPGRFDTDPKDWSK